MPRMKPYDNRTRDDAKARMVDARYGMLGAGVTYEFLVALREEAYRMIRTIESFPLFQAGVEGHAAESEG